tara:strand:- start:31 stop:2412 length:2382 start_codon:yes stop_codon:yes gene_type:complete
MKVSLNWLKDYLELPESSELISDKLTALGLESAYYNIGKSFTDVVLGYVVNCSPHQNADKLSVCEVDIGDGENQTIVCGAPNVKADINVAIAKVGASLQNGSFKINKAKLRGVESSGMICSGKELEINDDHSGIMILDTDAKLGTPIEDILEFDEDVVFEIDLTPNRGDCLSHLGVARELCISDNISILNRDINLIESKFQDKNSFKVSIKDSKACPRYSARLIKNVKVGSSPEWLVKRLSAIGQPSINNIVDAANYVLMDLGHPMHTFDYDKISGKKINIQYAKDGEKFITLDDKVRELKDFHLLICDSNKPIALAGIMGGANSEISDTTRNILIESAYFSPTVIRKGAKSLDISTEASRRFERDTDIESLIPALDQLSALILELAGGEICQEVVDEYPIKKKITNIAFSLKNCEDLLGMSISESHIEKIFKSLQIVFKKNGNIYKCSIPTFRNDLEREVDLCEEVARVIGYDNIPPSINFSGSYSSFVPDEQRLDSLIRIHLSSNGFHEHFSNSLQSNKDVQKFSLAESIKIKNPLSQDMAFMRNSIMPGLIKAASYNEKRQEKEFKLFEIGAVHNQSKKSDTGSKEKFRLGLLWYGKQRSHWRNYGERDIFSCKGDIVHMLESIGIKAISFKLGDQLGFENGLKVYSGKTQIGFLGSLDPNTIQEYELKVNAIFCDISVQNLREIWLNSKMSYSAPIAFPTVSRDIALQVANNVSADSLLKTIKVEGGKKLIDVTLFDIYQSEDVGNKNKSLAFSLKFQSKAATLTDSEVDIDVEKVLNSLKSTHGAIQR